MTYAINRIRSAQAALDVWPLRARARISRALEKTPTLLSPLDIETGIRWGRYSLWEISDEDGADVCSFVTEVVSGENGSAVNVLVLGGEGMPDWIGELTDALVEYAHSRGCDMILETGRSGWGRVLRRHGWSDGPATMMMKVA